MEETKLTKKELKFIETTAQKLFSLLEIQGGLELVENNQNIEIFLDTQDASLVIGYHGEGLDSLQLILSLMISRHLNRFVRVSIEVDGYKKNRTEYLEKLAEQIKEKVLTDNKEHVLFSLKPWERRIVHLYFSNDDQVVSESKGEGKDRVLVLKPRS